MFIQASSGVNYRFSWNNSAADWDNPLKNTSRNVSSEGPRRFCLWFSSGCISIRTCLIYLVWHTPFEFVGITLSAVRQGKIVSIPLLFDDDIMFLFLLYIDCDSCLLIWQDIVTRYAHQSGYHVERRFGWDCHGLPVVCDFMDYICFWIWVHVL